MKAHSSFFGNFGKGLPIYQFLAVFSGTLNALCSGMHYGWSSPSLPKLLQADSPIPLTNDESSWVAVILLVGTCIGSASGAILLDRIGRKNTILLTSVPFFTAWIMVAFAKSLPELLIARILAGIGDGLVFCALSIYVGEISNPNIRGFAGAYLSVSLAMGLLLMNIIGSYLSITEAALVASFVPVLLLITFSWMPESPYYLIMKGRHDQAKRNLMILKGTEDVDEELARLIQAITKQNSDTKRCTDLCAERASWKALIIGAGVRSAQALSGTIGVTFYSQTIFQEAGGSISPSNSSTIYFTTYMTVLGISSLIVDKVGRKPLLIISVTGAGLALTVVGGYFYIKNVVGMDTTSFTWVPIFALIAYVITYCLGLQPMANLMVGELFPTNVKAFATTLCTLCYAACTATASKLFQVAKDELGMHVPFFGFAVCCAVSLMFIIFMVPETKGKTLEDIQEELGGKRAKKNLVEFPDKFQKTEKA